jgi:hypothetical protein
MRSAVQIFLSLLVLSTVSVTGAWLLSLGLIPERQHPQLRRSLVVWSVKGLAVPLLIWTLLNLGLSWNLQPFMPQVQAARNNGIDWFPEYLRVIAFGLFVISSYWTAVTLGWTLLDVSRAVEGENREQFKALCLTCVLAMAVPAFLLVFFGGCSLLGLAGIALLAPMAGYGPAVLHAKPTPPIYARAIARMNFGKYNEAEWEIIHELEKCEDDFDGWMMLAGLYANQFHDLPEAERSILELCDQPKTSPPQLSIALHRLADWHLQLAGDPAAARRDLQMICNRLPGTHLARMAQLRINQLPVSREELRRQQTASAIPLPALSESIDKAPPPPDSARQHQQAADDASACVEILKHDPNNVSARERLARLFAEHLDKPDQAIDQVNLLLAMPDQPDGRRAEWLSLVAAWHIRYRHDTDTGRQTLERLLREFPQSVQAFAARRRLHLLDVEAKARSRARA